MGRAFPLRRREALGLLVALPWLATGSPSFGEDASPEDDPRARWLAGTSPLPGQPATAEWLAFAAAEDERWAREATRLKLVADWSQRDLAPLIARPPVAGPRPLLYPFGGPDAMHAIALFGDAPRALLVGLEPTGFLPDVGPRADSEYFTALGAAMGDLHRLTFFRTRAMSGDLAELGVLPLLVATVVRMGGRVSRVARLSPTRVAIAWISPGGGPRRLDYAQADLSNGSLARHPEHVALLRELGPSVTLLKAASFLLGEPRFSSARRLLLEVSDAVVQDDSGLPFASFDDAWSVHLFGRYAPPSRPFEDRRQPDLEAAFAERRPPPLPFGLGYQVRPRTSSLVVAVKRGA